MFNGVIYTVEKTREFNQNRRVHPSAADLERLRATPKPAPTGGRVRVRAFVARLLAVGRRQRAGASAFAASPARTGSSAGQRGAAGPAEPGAASARRRLT